jgi:uncharacterized protein YigE (DUF2233 family)
LALRQTVLRRAAILAALLAFPFAARAEWTHLSTQSLGQPAPGVEVLETKLENPASKSTARVVAIVFDTRAHTLRVVDSPEPGQASLASVLEKRNAIAGVNGGYFEPDFTPVGLVVADGKTLRAFKQARLLAGIVGVSPKGALSIVRSARFDPKPGTYRDALQCGPMLVEHSAPVVGLNAEKIARRTAVATGPGRHAALLWISSVTLADAAEILSLPGVLGDWKPASALNLDGGSSSGLWARGTTSLPEIKRVRNFLELVPR